MFDFGLRRLEPAQARSRRTRCYVAIRAFVGARGEPANCVVLVFKRARFRARYRGARFPVSEASGLTARSSALGGIV